MGGLVGGLFDLFAGDPTKSETAALGCLGTGQVATGEGLVTPAATYYEDILSGDPSKIAEAEAPAISVGQNQLEQQRLTGAEFGTRSGGTTAAENAAESKERANIINLTGQLQGQAAAAAGSLGTEQESLGAGNIGAQAELAARNRQREVGDISNVAQGAAELITGIPATGAGAPTMETPALATVAPESLQAPQDLFNPDDLSLQYQ